MYLSLTQIYKFKGKGQFTTAGIIIDAVRKLHKNSNKDYCMKIKIMDQFYQYCEVFIYSNDINIFPQNIILGDILFLRNYNFDLWNFQLQGKTPFKSNNASFKFYSIKQNYFQYYPIQIDLENQDYKTDLVLQELSNFSKSQFTIKNIPIYNQGLCSDFDMFLRVVSTQKYADYYKIKMTDEYNKYQLNHNEIVKPNVYKVRSIAGYSWNNYCFELVGNDYTSFLQVPKWMKSHSYTQWFRLAPKMIKSPSQNKQDDNTNSFQTKNKLISTKIISNANLNRKTMTLKQIQIKQKHKQQIIIECEFVEMFTDFKKALKKLDLKNWVEKNYESKLGEYIYNIHFAITDESMQGEIFNIYLYTYDKRGLQFLPGLNPTNLYGKNILNFAEKYTNIKNALLEYTEIHQSPLKIVISPLSNGKQTIYRIVDTQLII